MLVGIGENLHTFGEKKFGSEMFPVKVKETHRIEKHPVGKNWVFLHIGN